MSTNSLEQRITNFMAGAVPWLAPVPSAALVVNSTQKHLAWSEPIAVIAGAVIEGLGLTSTSTALTLWDWNARKPKDEPKAPFWIAAVLVGVYFVSTIGLTVVLDADSGMTHVAPAIFPVLAIVATVNIALRSQHAHRLERISAAGEAARLAAEKAQQEARRAAAEAKAEQLRREQDAKAEAERKESERKAEREARRLERKAERQANAQQSVNGLSIDGVLDTNQALLQAGRASKKASNIDTMLDIFRTDPHAEIAGVARQVGIGRQTVYNYLDELQKAGKVHVNGNGVEVLS